MGGGRAEAQCGEQQICGESFQHTKFGVRLDIVMDTDSGEESAVQSHGDLFRRHRLQTLTECLDLMNMGLVKRTKVETITHEEHTVTRPEGGAQNLWETNGGT